MIEISIVIPVFNEQDTITELHNRLQASVSSITPNYELIFVNDGSKDFTLLKLIELAEHDSRVKYISFSRNFGHQIALSAGFDHCKGKAVVIIDGDLQDPPELIPALYKKFMEGYEVVYARRTKRRGETLFKRTAAKLFYRMMKRTTSFDFPLDVGDFRLVDRTIVEHLKQMPEQNKFLRGQIAWLGFRQTFVDFERDSRKAGQTGYPLEKLIRLAVDGITAFSDFPLRLIANLGLSIFLVSFIIILCALCAHYFLGQPLTGCASLMISVMFIGGVQLLAIGIIGEYISRINSNVRNRPLYIVEKTNVDSKEDGSSN